MSLVTIHKLDINFPYEPYACQIQYMETVVKALDTGEDAALESPTGTGKTLSLLCTVLAWMKRQKEVLFSTQTIANSLAMGFNGDPKKVTAGVPRIFYASRTHSQLSQVVRELNKTLYKDIKVATLGSRDQLCINESVKKEKDNQSKVLKCRSIVKRRECHYYNSWDHQDPTALDEVYAEAGKVLDIEDLVKTATKHKHCPYFRSRQLQEKAELMLLPYNYLLDPHLRQIHKIDLRNSILIFDEAHNLESVCQESVSCSISTQDVAFCIKEVKVALQALHDRNEESRAEMDASTAAFGSGMEKEKRKEKEINVAEVANVLESLQLLLDAMDELYAKGIMIEQLENQPGKVFAGGSLVSILQKAAFRRETAAAKAELLQDLANFIADEPEATEGTVIIRERGKKMMDFGNFLCKVFADSFEAVARKGITDEDVASENFKVYAVKEDTKIILHYWCFSAGLAMRFLRSRGVHSILVTSGTLSPLQQFTRTLGIPFGFTLQNEHAAKSSQLLVLRIGQGSMNGNPVALSGTFKKRDSAEYLYGIGDGVVRVASAVPQGILVFFSSYALMDKCITTWKQRGFDPIGIWERIQRFKDIYVEPRSKGELAAVRVQFEASVHNKGAVFFAVLRGKVSEGIDFADAHSRAVVVIGIPYPPIADPKVLLKRSHLNEKHKKEKNKENAMTGEQWYSTEGFRAVNQAIGRVLRHVNDFGVVVLLDERFNRHLSQNLPKWVRNSFSNCDTTLESERVLRDFFSSRMGEVASSSRAATAWKGGQGGSTVARERKRPMPLNTTTLPQDMQALARSYSHDGGRRQAEGSLTGVAPSARAASLNDSIIALSPSAPSSSTALPPQQRPPPHKKIRLKANGRLGEKATETAPVASAAAEGGKEARDSRKRQLKDLLQGLGLREEVWDWLGEFKRTSDGTQLCLRVTTRLLPRSIQAVLLLRDFVPDAVQQLLDDEIKKQQAKSSSLLL